MRKSNPTTSRGNTNGLCCGMGLIQVIVLCMCIGQSFLIFFLLANHDIFRTSITDIGQLTTNLLKTETSRIQGVISSSEYNRRTSDISPPLSSEPFLVEYTNNFPVIIKSIDNDNFIPIDSKPIVRSILGTIIDVNFPDLSYRPKEVVRSQYTTIFEELPTYGFLQEFKNPCWRDSNNRVRCLPFAYILGQPKCGTSDLFERMRVHQDIVAPVRKEIRWFTRGEFQTHAMWHEGMENENVDQVGEPLLGPGSTLSTFSRSFRALQNALETSPELHKDKITIDGGPHTFWWPTQSPDGNYESWDVPPPQLLREIQPQAKFILTLSDPVKRMFSDYYFLEDNLKPVRPGGAFSKSARQFHDRAKLQVETFQKCVKNYVESLQEQIATSKNYHYIARNSSDAAILAAVRDSVPKEYQNVFPLWFRASQMCAHDRHSFGVGGHGRLSIGLYVLYLEKWLEHFPLQQFLVLRLEDYEKDPKAHMQKVFDHLALDDPDDWDRLLRGKKANEHKVHRDVILEETETLLRAFHKPYNALLAALLKNPDFRWEPLLVNGVRVTLRSQQIVAARQEQQKQQQQAPDDTEASSLLIPRPGTHSEEQQNAHGIDRHVDPRLSQSLPVHPHPHPPQEGDPVHLRGRRVDDNNNNINLAYQLKPRRFSLDNLSPPRDEDLDAVDLDAMAVDLTEMKVGKDVCTAAFTLNIAKLKAWFYDIGVPGSVVSLGDGRRTAFHCLAALYTMGEAHSRSHVFAELKGKETWLTPLFDPPLDAKMSSVLSRDITDHLSGAILRTAAWLQRAGVPLDAVDTGGNTALHVAVLGGETSLVRFLIESGSALDIANNEKRTPLHFAAAYGHAEICGLLLAAGAKGDVHDLNGVSAMDIILNPGPILKEDAKKYMNIEQRPARQIDRRLHPELHPSEDRLGWKPGTGGWSPERLKGFETDMECDVVDQYFADEITGEEIFKNYLAHNAPVLIRGLLPDWPVTNLYQMDVLLEDHGDLNVQVSDIPYAQKFGGGQQVTMTLREYIEEVKAHQIVGGNHPWYVFKGHPIPAASDRADSLVKYETCPIPDILATAFAQASPPNAMNSNNNNNKQNEGVARRNMFVNAQWALGGAGTGAPIHFHNTAWAALVYGAKKWMIYPPHNMIMSNRQILDFYETEKDSFAARGVTPVTCVQTAGDVMIIPESWGHGVLNIQETIAIATEFKHAVWRMKPPVHSVSSGAPNFDNRVDRPPLDPGRRVATQDNALGRSAAKKRFIG